MNVSSFCLGPALRYIYKESLKLAKKEKPIFQAHERFLSILFHPKDFFFTLFHYDNLQNVNPNPSHTGFLGSGRNMLCSAKKKINAVTIEIKRYLYFCIVCLYFSMFAKQTRLKLLPVKLF